MNSNVQSILQKRIEELCKEKGMTYYSLSYKATIPLTTLIHIMDGSTKNPGVFTIMKICDGLGIGLDYALYDILPKNSLPDDPIIVEAASVMSNMDEAHKQYVLFMIKEYMKRFSQ